jgi:hypothetical protein
LKFKRVPVQSCLFSQSGSAMDLDPIIYILI